MTTSSTLKTYLQARYELIQEFINTYYGSHKEASMWGINRAGTLITIGKDKWHLSDILRALELQMPKKVILKWLQTYKSTPTMITLEGFCKFYRSIEPDIFQRNDFLMPLQFIDFLEQNGIKKEYKSSNFKSPVYQIAMKLYENTDFKREWATAFVELDIKSFLAKHGIKIADNPTSTGYKALMFMKNEMPGWWISEDPTDCCNC